MLSSGKHERGQNPREKTRVTCSMLSVRRNAAKGKRVVEKKRKRTKTSGGDSSLLVFAGLFQALAAILPVLTISGQLVIL